MKFEVEKREQRNVEKYYSKDIETARKFARLMYSEFGNFIRGLVLFGSTTKTPSSPKKDIDILIILDDVRVKFSRELIETYRIITEKVVANVDPQRLHIQSMKFSSFWEYVRAGDPVAINILRSGVALIDTGFFDPLQVLLEQGRIRPSEESIFTYFTMAPASLNRSQQHLLTATVDLYWAAIDAAHAALMKSGEIPPSPEHVADLLERKLVRDGHINKKYADVMRQLYSLFKKIVHRDIKEISGKEYDHYHELTQAFVKGMQKYIEEY
ncbi:MAG: hypothetical protein AABW58_01455 [Nanoarchaeota archaeon]